MRRAHRIRRPASPRNRVATTVVALTSVAIAVAGCARFDDSTSTPFTPPPSYTGGGVDRPPGERPSSPPATPPETGPCVDPDPAVVETCLDVTSAVIPMPDGRSALVAERLTGRILLVAPDSEPQEFARVPVDATGDGGLTDIALSPDYAEDRLVYAFVTTGGDNRVVRVAKGDTPKPILTGIPRGATGNRGAIEFVAPDRLYVATSDAGDTAAADDPSSLGGKVLDVRLPRSGEPAPSSVIVSGLGTTGDLCRDPSGGVWVTDRGVTEDRLRHIGADGAAPSTPAWTWPERPGVAGCAATPQSVAIALTDRRAVSIVPVDPQSGAVVAAPADSLQDRYGRPTGAEAGLDGTLWLSTGNKLDAPGPTDDRVVRIPMPAGAGGPD